MDTEIKKKSYRFRIRPVHAHRGRPWSTNSGFVPDSDKSTRRCRR